MPYLPNQLLQLQPKHVGFEMVPRVGNLQHLRRIRRLEERLTGVQSRLAVQILFITISIVLAVAFDVLMPYLWNTRVLGVRIKQARCTCFATQMSPKAVWSRRLRNMQVSRC